MDPASLRILRWRTEGTPARIGQIVLIGALIWLHTRANVVLAWFALACATALADAVLSRRLLSRLADRGLTAITVISRLASAAAFAVVCFILLLDRSGFGLAAAMLVGCAINLNNAVMTRGSWGFSLSLVGPSSACLMALPVTAYALGHRLSGAEVAMLTIGAGAYTVFIALLASALYRESQALRAALEAAEAASRAKSAFLAITSHEIRTPLNGVLGMAQAMDNDALSPVQRERLGVIRQSGEALLEILNDVLDVSKIEAGKLELERAPFDLEAVTLAAHAAFSASAAKKGLSFGVRIDETARGFYEGDAARVRQVLVNLISNALKFTDAGGVEVMVAGHAGGVRWSVTDSGPGVAPERVSQLFDKFVQADSSTTRRFGGTGLGLAICRELCEAMGGTISVQSEVGRGSVFTVELPLACAPSPGPTGAPADLAADGAPDKPVRFLAAEDNRVNQLVLRTLLDQIGVETAIVETGSAAVAAWEAGDFDQILMDVQMPGMDGPSAAREIRRREGLSGRTRIPIIALTADAMKHQVDTYAASGMDAFVPKPIEVATLYAAIARFAGGQAQADPAADQPARPAAARV
ncbi:MAG: ATP-binding protein [Caulobacterales bacterium]